MTPILQQAFQTAQALPEEEQDAIAAILIEEMASTNDRTKIAGIVAVLTRRQREALAILVKMGRPLRNRDFTYFSGRRKTGFAKALGPCTKPREHDAASLWARGLVRVVEGLFYTITEDGWDVAREIGPTD